MTFYYFTIGIYRTKVAGEEFIPPSFLASMKDSIRKLKDMSLPLAAADDESSE
ncbi:hypothetical protein VNI00_013039 [Paramarasmius palmivorus]|uniref:Uncharacterized protein n=1 Tax=Paramarasmius palmivorus TaxID=297713 RepID=A0AAW0BZT0_9AGAR